MPQGHLDSQIATDVACDGCMLNSGTGRCGKVTKEDPWRAGLNAPRARGQDVLAVMAEQTLSGKSDG